MLEQDKEMEQKYTNTIILRKDRVDTSFNSNIKVLERFAIAFSEHSSLKKTQLHLISKLRWDSFERYLEWFQIKDYVKYTNDMDDKGKYHVTENGREMFYRLLKLLEYIQRGTM